MSQKNHLIKNQELFAYLPPEIIIGILSRLPVRSILSCKCVCKSWLTLLESNEFVKSHLLKAIPGLVVYRFRLKLFKFFDFEDGLDLEHHGLHFKFVTEFNIPGCNGWIAGSADGLLFVCNKYHLFEDHESVPLPGGPPLHCVPKSECVCHVYTIGTGLWRRISPVPQLYFLRDGDGAFLNGNLHWSVSDFEGPRLLISCFDLETERFSTFSTPLRQSALTAPPTIFEDCLCLCDTTRYGDGIAIWLMKEYGVEKSWTKQFFIVHAQPFETTFYIDEAAYPIQIFEHGDILLAWDDECLYYSKKNDAVLKRLTFDYINPFLHTPSFLSLKSFGMEKIIWRPFSSETFHLLRLEGDDQDDDDEVVIIIDFIFSGFQLILESGPNVWWCDDGVFVDGGDRKIRWWRRAIEREHWFLGLRPLLSATGNEGSLPKLFVFRPQWGFVFSVQRPFHCDCPFTAKG
ncbi:hypothetical protein ACS0TY_028352 [Phlomoides rotata]